MEEEIEKEEKEEKPKKKDSKNIIILIFGIIIVVLVAVLLIVLGKDKWIPGQGKEKDNVEDKNNTEEKDEVVTDAEKEQINKKIYRIVGIGPTTQNAYRFRGDALKRQLKSGEKQYIVLLTGSYDEITDDSWKEIPTVKEVIENELAHVNLSNMSEQDYIKQEYHYKKLEDVKEDYKNMFGEELTDPIDNIGRCPPVYYFKEQEVYYQYPPRCGGTSASDVLSYITDYQKKNGEIRVNLYIGFSSPKGNDISSSEKELFSDFEIVEESNSDVILFSTIRGVNPVETTEKNENGFYIINDNNKELFSKYQLTFKKLKNGEYYFVKAEQVK